MCTGSLLILTGSTKEETSIDIGDRTTDSNKVLLKAIIRDWQFQGTAISSGQKYSAHKNLTQ